MTQDPPNQGSSFYYPATSGPYLHDGAPFRISAVLFDFDGTITEPGQLDLPAIKRAIGCPKDRGILEYIEDTEDLVDRGRYQALMEQAELEAADQATPRAGAEALISFLRDHGIPMAIVTRNRTEAVARALTNLPGIERSDFAVVVGRDLPLSPKPFPDGVEYVAQKLGVDAGRLLVIGDHTFDVEAGERAGALTMLLQNDPSASGLMEDVDFVVSDLVAALQIVRYGIPLPVGKFPVDFLRDGLTRIAGTDSSVLVRAGIGEDAAAMNIQRDEVLVLASDPITLAADSLAQYAVLANANDVATSGATPRWLLATLLFPPGWSASEVLALARDIGEICAAHGVYLCGGHTEITDSVRSPLVVGTMAGTARAAELLDKKKMRQGDRILMTKCVAVEGTALLAREFRERLLAEGFTSDEIGECAQFLEKMGILEEARIARSYDGVTAMHDVTEGGLATAVRELSAAGGRRLRRHLDRIPVYLRTKRICAALGIDPLGLIGSGSLLITCSPADTGPLISSMTSAGIEITDIGEVLGPGEGIDASIGNVQAEWPQFDRDEISRLIS